MQFEHTPSVLQRPRKLEERHTIVCGNEKGGSGKSTISMHIAVGLLQLGFRVATIDLDTRQQSLTRFNAYRRRWMEQADVKIAAPDHYSLHHEAALLYEISTNETTDAFAEFVSGISAEYDFIVVDTPGSYTMLSTAAHRLADTLITPINDSFMDFDVLANVNPQTFEIESIAQYASSVRDARHLRKEKEGVILDWVVVRNRLSSITSRNEKRVDQCLRELSMRLGFRLADGIAERVVYRESFVRGLTALDDTAEHTNGLKLSMSHLTARNEVRALINALRLPIDENSQKRAETRKAWFGLKRPTLKVPHIFAN